jgi:ectoine hydroxylase-related dioxygenase (phytanoyl-CoA dioxygenase family)
MKKTLVIPSESLLKAPVLYHLWLRTTQQQPVKIYNWLEETYFLYQLGLGMEEVIRFLFEAQPSFADFEAWIVAKDLGIKNAEDVQVALEREKVEREEEIPDVLGAEEMDFWRKNGYIVLKNAVTEAQVKAANQAIWTHLGASLENEESWYKSHKDLYGIMLAIHHHEAFRAIRASTRIRRAYQQLYGTKNIYKVIDKVGFNPPNSPKYSFKGSDLHWDTSLVLPIPDRFQGLLYLTDTGENDGAFHCVSGFHLEIENWLQSLAPGISPRDTAPQALKASPITGNAGDFVIWHQALPHCATPNKGKTPRLVQYFTYLPLVLEKEREWK